MSVNKFLNEFYNTTSTQKTASAEDLEKQASVELFMKLAQDQNIDLASMPDAQVEALYASWVQKTAGAPAEKTAGEDDDKKKREAAEKELEEKKAAQEKVAEADFLGRVMAHAYAQELQKIASAKEAEMPEALRAAMAAKGDKKDEKKDDEDKKDEKKASALPTLSKRASAIEELAMTHAVKLAQDANFDTDEAARRVAAVVELGLVGESTKIAGVSSVDEAVHLRALELLEAAKYPVTWNQ